MKRWIRILLLVCLPYTAFAQSVTVDFDNPSPPGGQGSFVQGEFGGINWGSNQWRWGGPYGPNRTNNVYFGSGSGSSRDISFPTDPRLFVSIEVYALTAGTLTITDDQGQFFEQIIVTGSLQSVTTGWTMPSTVVTINFASGWDLGVDNFVHTAGAPPPPLPPDKGACVVSVASAE